VAFYEVPTETRTGIALVNSEQVTLLATPDHRRDLRIIYLMTGSRISSEYAKAEVATTASLDSLLEAFGPFVKVQRVQMIGNPWNHYYVRLAAIASVEPLEDGRGSVRLMDGYELMIKDVSVFRGAGVEAISLA